MFEPTAIYAPNPHRYDTMTYNRAGTSGLKLPAVSLGFWHNFGDITPFDQMKSLVFTAFDNGITHFDLANNYGPEPGQAEKNCGLLLAKYFKHHRDELVISTKAGYEMWTGPYGDLGSPQVPARQPRPVAGTLGLGLCGHLLPPPPGSGNPA